MTREEAIRVLEKEKRFLFHGSSSDKCYEPAFDMAIEALKEPERKKSKWERTNLPYSTLCKCSNCGYDSGSILFNYCPDCGAEMEEE